MACPENQTWQEGEEAQSRERGQRSELCADLLLVDRDQGTLGILEHPSQDLARRRFRNSFDNHKVAADPVRA